MWLDAAVYDLPIEDAHINCHTCGKNMDPFGYHSLANCASGYGRTVRHNHVSRDIREQALVASGIPSRLEETGLLPDADDRPGDICVTSAAGCTEESFHSTAFDLTVHVSMPDNG